MGAESRQKIPQEISNLNLTIHNMRNEIIELQGKIPAVPGFPQPEHEAIVQEALSEHETTIQFLQSRIQESAQLQERQKESLDQSQTAIQNLQDTNRREHAQAMTTQQMREQILQEVREEVRPQQECRNDDSNLQIGRLNETIRDLTQ